jgi:hypothetical protein
VSSCCDLFLIFPLADPGAERARARARGETERTRARAREERQSARARARERELFQEFKEFSFSKVITWEKNTIFISLRERGLLPCKDLIFFFAEKSKNVSPNYPENKKHHKLLHPEHL